MTITQFQEELRALSGRMEERLAFTEGLIAAWPNAEISEERRKWAADCRTIISLLRHAEGVGWRPIEKHDGYSYPCLVCRRQGDGPYYEPKCAFIDATGIWRIAGGSGSTPLHFEPTYWMPLPNPPQEGRGAQDMASRDQPCGDAQERCPSAQNSAGGEG